MGTGNELITVGSLYHVFEGVRPCGPLPELCLGLLAEQKKSWPAAAAGYESLRHVREREIACHGFSVRVQYNPGRIKSTLADVGESDVSRRACFLCPANLPKEQEGVLYRKEYLILCNPMPVFSPHFTVSHLEHRPQGLAGAVATLFQLMSDFGPGFLILYNGPACGASAPDHLHFQAAPAGRMPVEKESQAKQKLLRRWPTGVSLVQPEGIGRAVIILEGEEPAGVGDALLAFMGGLKSVLSTDREPMVNLICFRRGLTYTVLLFPRLKHRPDAYYLKGDGRLAISPAVVEMGGIMVTPLERDFERLDGASAEQIFNEVSLPGELVQQAVEAMG